MKINFEPESFREAFFLNGVKHAISSVKEAVATFSASQVKELYDKCIAALEQNPKFKKLAGFDVREELQKLGINNAEDLKNFIISKKNEFKYTGLSALQAYLETQLQDMYNAGSANKQEPYETVGLQKPSGDLNKLIACRNCYGNGPVLFYSLNDYTIGEIKRLYASDTRTSYTDARPIMYSTWVKLSPEMQHKTR